MGIPLFGRVLVALAVVSALCAAEDTKRAPEKPVQILVFTDLECPFCGDLAPKLTAVAKEFEGQAQVIVKHNPLPIHAHSRAAHAAMISAGQQGKAPEMYKLLFAHQLKLGDADLSGYASELGLDIPAFQQYIASGKAESIIDADLAEAQALGVAGTPTLFINGEKLVGTQTVEALRLAIRRAMGEETTPVPDAGPVEVRGQGAFSRGPADAPVTIVEFTDLQCPFCAREDPILNKVAEQYPTQIRLVYKFFPLDFHDQAMPAAEAVMAAGEQGKSWEMYEYLLGHQNALGRATFDSFAAQAGLDLKRFDADLENHVYRARVESDRAEGARLGVTGTPMFYINGRPLDGARPEPEFFSAVKTELARLSLPGGPERIPQIEVAKAAEVERPRRYLKGSASAPILVEWYSDVQSPLAPRASQLMDELMRLYPDHVQVVFRHRPLENRPQSWLAHEALAAAGAQGAFWPMHDLLLKNAKPWTAAGLEALAENLSIDHALFSQALRDHRYLAEVQRDVDAANRAEIRGTPVFFVNGNRVDGLQPMHVLLDYIPPSEKRLALEREPLRVAGSSE